MSQCACEHIHCTHNKENEFRCCPNIGTKQEQWMGMKFTICDDCFKFWTSFKREQGKAYAS